MHNDKLFYNEDNKNRCHSPSGTIMFVRIIGGYWIEHRHVSDIIINTSKHESDKKNLLFSYFECVFVISSFGKVSCKVACFLNVCNIDKYIITMVPAFLSHHGRGLLDQKRPWLV